MTAEPLQDMESIADDLGMLMELTRRLVEAYYEDNQIDLAQLRITRLRARIDKERQRIARWRIVVHSRKELDKRRKGNEPES
jgi:hypothetical protein